MQVRDTISKKRLLMGNKLPEKKVVIVGAGNIGRFAVYALLKKKVINSFTVIDNDPAKIEPIRELIGKIGDNKVEVIIGDVFNDRIAKRKLCDADIVLSYLPGHLGFKIYTNALECRFDLIDTSFMPEDPLELASHARDAGITIVPDTGVAPGLSNMIVGYYYNTLREPDTVKIYVGGLPDKPKPPLFHEVNWSLVDLFEEYTRPARIIVNGEIKSVEPLTGIETVEISGFGSLEAFYTDGLRTLLKTVKPRNMFEKTLRYKWHLDIVRTLRDLGFLSKTPIIIEGHTVTPLKLTAKIIGDKLYNPMLKDILVMMIYLSKDSKTIVYDVYDQFNEKTGFSAMARTTGLASVATLKLLIEKRIGKGVVPPEIIAQKESNFREVTDLYEEFGVKMSYREIIQ